MGSSGLIDTEYSTSDAPGAAPLPGSSVVSVKVPSAAISPQGTKLGCAIGKKRIWPPVRGLPSVCTTRPLTGYSGKLLSPRPPWPPQPEAARKVAALNPRRHEHVA